MQASSLMNRLLGTAPRLVLAGVLGTFAGTAWAADQPALQAIDVQPLPGQQLQITLRLSGPAPPPLSFTIDCRRSPAAAGRVTVQLSDPHLHVNLHHIGDQVVVDFSDASVPTNLMRRYDASDFGTPIRGFDVTRVGNGSRISITASGDYEQLAYQSDDQYVVEIAPRRKAANAQEERPVYTGERLTLNFQDIETRAVLQLLADARG